MKRAIFLFLIISLSACRVTNSDNSNINTEMIVNPLGSEDLKGQAKMVFEQTVFDFGKISQGEKRNFTFTFTNEGDAPLVLSSVNPSCGCTIPKDWPKTPIMPGEQREITAEYNSEGKEGVQNTGITIVSNSTPATTVLYLNGEVMAPK